MNGKFKEIFGQPSHLTQKMLQTLTNISETHDLTGYAHKIRPTVNNGLRQDGIDTQI